MTSPIDPLKKTSQDISNPEGENSVELQEEVSRRDACPHEN
jgi:hypothetical protein